MHSKKCNTWKKSSLRAISMILVVTLLLTGTIFFSSPLTGVANAAPVEASVLDSLSLSGITLSPAFNPNITSYTATVGYNVNSTIVAATTSAAAITVSGDLGGQTLSAGTNSFTVNLVDNGTSTVVNSYTIKINKYARIDERDSAVTRSGAGWNLSGDSGDYSSTLTASYTTGDYLEYTQSCSRIKLGTRRGPGAGIVDIYLDGVLVKGNFDLWVSSRLNQQEIYDSGDLTPGVHTVKMVMKGTTTHNVATPYGQLDYIEYVPCVASIAISGQSGASVITTKGGTLQMVADVLPAGAAIDRSVTWSVTNGTGSATISPSGLLTAVTDGTVNVKATANDGTGIVSNEYPVTIYCQDGSNFLPVTAINVSSQSGSSIITTEGGTMQMEAEVSADNATNPTVIWSVTDGTGKATINEDGLLTAVSKGTVTVKATAMDGSGVQSNEYIVALLILRLHSAIP